MEFKQIISRFVYRIEPKPGGGFIATCKDENAPPIEGVTRAEVQQKIQVAIQAQLAQQFPALASAMQGKEVKLHYHIDPKPEGGYLIHHGDPAQGSIEGTTREHLESAIESKLFSALLERLSPELHRQITDKLNSGGLDITVDRQVNFSARNVQIDGIPPSALEKLEALEGKTANRTPVSIESSTGTLEPGTINPSPITYEKNNSGRFFRLLLMFAIVALLIYVYLHRAR